MSRTNKNASPLLDSEEAVAAAQDPSQDAAEDGAAGRVVGHPDRAAVALPRLGAEPLSAKDPLRRRGEDKL
jgi:hypothetical protein